MKIRNVLSLFDGISCGQLALKKAGIEYDKYYASEIEKQPIWITQYNFPNTIQLGDVEKWKEWDIEWDKIDLLIGGSPCTNLSIAGNREGLKGEQSRLFYAYVDILNHLKKFNPNVKFLLENVESMTDSDKGIINSYMGCKPIMINSSLVSAQNRKRYYWFNWSLKKESLFGMPTCSIPQPKDKHILLKDILETGVASMDKSITLCATDYKGMGADPLTYATNHQPRPFACEPVDGKDTNFVTNFVEKKYKEFNKKNGYIPEIFSPYNLSEIQEKSPALTTGCGSPTTTSGFLFFEPIKDAVCMRLERTEEGKKLRKDYESGKIHHGFNEHRMLTPRTDNKTNTLTTVGKDNLVCEPICENKDAYAGRLVGRRLDENGKRVDYSNNEIVQKVEVNDDPNKTNTLTTVEKDNMIISPIGINYFRDYGSKGKILTDSDEKTQTLTAAMGCGGGNIPAIAKSIKSENLDCLGNSQKYKIYSVKNKSVCLNADNGSKASTYKINLPDGDYIIRKLTPIECERLQTVPDDYTKFGFDGQKDVKISNGARYKALGNGWTVDVITHIFSFLEK